MRRVFNSQERKEREIREKEAAGVGESAGGEQTAVTAAKCPGGKGKKRGKCSRHGHKKEAQRGKAEVVGWFCSMKRYRAFSAA